MNIKDAIASRRTVRSFCDEPVDFEILKKICEDSRLYASSANLQPIRYKIVNDKPTADLIFQHIHLAGYIPNYEVEPQNQPPAYILLLTERKVDENPQFDVGAASTNIMLLAKEYGLDTCCIGNFSKKEITDILKIDAERYKPLYLIAIGKSHQDNSIISLKDTVRYEYSDGNFIVPKRDIEDIII